MDYYTEEHSRLTGELQPARPTVQFVDVFSRRQKEELTVLAAFVAITGMALLFWLFWPSPDASAPTVVSVIILILMGVTELIRLSMTATLAIWAAIAKDPVPMEPPPNLRVAILTTIVPGKEPWDMVRVTLEAMLKITYPLGTVDVWLLDEGNDPLIEASCIDMGVKHFSRAPYAEYNLESGQFKARTKHGNHNSWGDVHGEKYDVVAQMDPDHVPFPNFLERSLGYFNDPDVAYMVAPQVYGNLAQNLIAKGSAIGAYIFHGIIQRGGNGLGAPLLIGTNHIYRTTAWNQMKGYYDCIVEDHATAIKVLSMHNPLTWNRWKGIYTPDILSIGEGPTTFSDWFQQQQRWAYGVWDILFRVTPLYFRQLTGGQRLMFGMLQSYYPLAAIGWVIGNIVTIMFLTSGHSTGKSALVWAALWLAAMWSSFGLFLWFRRFNLVEHEQKQWIAGMVLTLMTLPNYVVAGVQRLLRMPLRYRVTAKGKLAMADTLHTFRPHLFWSGVAVIMLAFSVSGIVGTFWILQFWMVVTLAICLSPVAVHYKARYDNRRTDQLLSANETPTGDIVAAMDHPLAIPSTLVTAPASAD